MASLVHKAALVIGLSCLIHAAYSAAQHRTYLRLTEEEFTHLPIDIILQCLLGQIITSWALVYVAGELKEIDVSAEMENKSWNTVGNRPSFYMFQHRGKVLFGDLKSEKMAIQSAVTNNSNSYMQHDRSDHHAMDLRSTAVSSGRRDLADFYDDEFDENEGDYDEEEEDVEGEDMEEDMDDSDVDRDEEDEDNSQDEHDHVTSTSKYAARR